MGRSIATLVVVAIALAMLLVLRPDRWLPSSIEAASPNPGASATLGPQPSLSPWDASAAEWSRLTISPLADGPIGASSVVPWPGGYLALGPGPEDLGLVAWASSDGRTWTALSAGTFGDRIAGAEAVPAFGGLLLAIERQDLTVSAYWSGDGLSWRQGIAPRLGIGAGGLAGHAGDLAGDAGAVIGVVAGESSRLAYSSDGASWQWAGLPGLNRSHVGAVAVGAAGYVALGSASLPVVTDSGVGGGESLEVATAWWSGDGLTWRAATLGTTLAGSFRDVYPGSAGLLAVSRSPGTIFTETTWQSADGRAWTVADTAPLDLVDGSVAGSYVGNGLRILAVAPAAPDGQTGYWTSLDGLAWTPLALGGEAAAAVDHATPLLLRDGVLFVDGEAAWFGTAAP